MTRILVDATWIGKGSDNAPLESAIIIVSITTTIAVCSVFISWEHETLPNNILGHSRARSK